MIGFTNLEDNNNDNNHNKVTSYLHAIWLFVLKIKLELKKTSANVFTTVFAKLKRALSSKFHWT